MKNNFLLLLIFLTGISFAQNANRIQFNYDANGNQTQRVVCFQCIAKATNQFKTKETVTEKDMLPMEEFTYYPNPVLDELYLKWKTAETNQIETIEVYSINGQLLKTYPNLKNDLSATIAFQNYPSGMYVLNLVYTNGEKKDIKITK